MPKTPRSSRKKTPRMDPEQRLLQGLQKYVDEKNN
jgi:hypothetical protein